MKSIVNLSVLVFLICMMFFISCKKEKTYSTNLSIVRQDSLLSTSPQDSLTGREFIFNGLVWAYDVDGAGNLYIDVEIPPELLIHSNQSVEVSVKPDSSNTWTIAEKFQYPNSSEFVYNFFLNSLYIFHNQNIFTWPADTYSAGKVFSVKVKFL